MKRPPEMTRKQFQAALKRNGFRQVLVWIEDTTGQVRGTSWGMVMHSSGKMAYRATIAKVIRERDAQIDRDRIAGLPDGWISPAHSKLERKSNV